MTREISLEDSIKACHAKINEAEAVLLVHYFGEQAEDADGQIRRDTPTEVS